MNLDPETYQALLQVFDQELEEQLDQMLSLLPASGQASDFDSANAETLFRIAHTIKGASRSVDLESVSLVGEKLEGLFKHILDEKLEITSQMISVCHSAVDTMRLAEKQFLDSRQDNYDVQEILDSLSNCWEAER